jgi:hypothetical protein
MYAYIRRYRSSDPEEGMRRVHEEFLPRVHQAPGLVSYTVVDLGSGAFAVVGVFDSREEADAFGRMSAEWVTENVWPLMMGRPDVAGGEVVVHVAR